MGCECTKDMSELHLHTAPKNNRRFWSAWRKANYEYVKSVLNDLPRESTLYDLGAGNVPFRDILFRFKYTGVDFVPFPDVSVVADLTALPVPDESADIITIMNTIEHVPDTKSLFAETRRILKKGGLMIGTVPFLMQVHQEPHDYNRYTKTQLEHLLKSAGFSDIVVVPLGNAIDVYDTIEMKFFASTSGFVARAMRAWRRLEMRLLRRVFGTAPANHRLTEGFGFTAQRPR